MSIDSSTLAPKAPPKSNRLWKLPSFCLVMLIGPSGSGKSTFAGKFFKQTAIISSDACRARITDNPEDQAVSADAFELVHQMVTQRLRYGRLAVVDATNTTAASRESLIKIAKKQGASPVAVVFQIAPDIAKSQNKMRQRQVPDSVIDKQFGELAQSLKDLLDEPFEHIFRIQHPSDVEQLSIESRSAPADQRSLKGPFDIIGDIHGCFDELVMLLKKLGYLLDFVGPSLRQAISFSLSHPGGRRPIFLGDLCDRGPLNHQVLRLVMDVVDRGEGLSLIGNHEIKLKRHLLGRKVSPTHGLQQTLDDLALEQPAFLQRILHFIDRCSPHLVLDEGQLVVAHAGLSETFHGFEGPKARSFALYGDVRKGTDAFGLPIRGDWAVDYKGTAKVVYGHTPVLEALWRYGTACIDTGCVFGGKLTAMKYPECIAVDVPAQRVYFEPIKPLSKLSEEPTQ